MVDWPLVFFLGMSLSFLSWVIKQMFASALALIQVLFGIVSIVNVENLLYAASLCGLAGIRKLFLNFNSYCTGGLRFISRSWCTNNVSSYKTHCWFLSS